MTDTTIATQGMSLDTFMQRYDEDGPFELIDGEIVPMSPTVMRHNKVMANLMWLLMNHVKPRNLGEVFAEAPFVLEDTSDWVKGSRVPDLMFVNAENFATYTKDKDDWEKKPLVLVPDFVVEIVSQNDSYTKITQKVDLYLADGVKLVWVVDPQQKTIDVYSEGQRLTFRDEDTLTAGEVIPGFEVKVSAVFE